MITTWGRSVLPIQHHATARAKWVTRSYPLSEAHGNTNSFEDDVRGTKIVDQNPVCIWCLRHRNILRQQNITSWVWYSLKLRVSMTELTSLAVYPRTLEFTLIFILSSRGKSKKALLCAKTSLISFWSMPWPVTAKRGSSAFGEIWW